MEVRNGAKIGGPCWNKKVRKLEEESCARGKPFEDDEETEIDLEKFVDDQLFFSDIG